MPFGLQKMQSSVHTLIYFCTLYIWQMNYVCSSEYKQSNKSQNSSGGISGTAGQDLLGFYFKTFWKEKNLCTSDKLQRRESRGNLLHHQVPATNTLLHHLKKLLRHLKAPDLSVPAGVDGVEDDILRCSAILLADISLLEHEGLVLLVCSCSVHTSQPQGTGLVMLRWQWTRSGSQGVWTGCKAEVKGK